jgi:2-C-methyl-D-erythritol 4-phosphate cytidylyltransferase
MSENVAVIICAAGSSSRFGGTKKKPFVDVGGRAAFLRSLEIFAEREDVKRILLAISPEDEELVSVKWGASLSFYKAKLCFGGAERFETVAKALEQVGDDVDFVAVHDAARCCLKAEWIEECFSKAFETGAAILARGMTDTVKRVKDSKIIETVDRSELWEVQTPQVFKKDILEKAYAEMDKLDAEKISDDSQLVEASGVEVSVVETDSTNIKLTYGGDIAIAEAIIKTRSQKVKKGYQGPYGDSQW